MIRICFSPDESFWIWRAVPLFMLMPIFPESDTVMVLLMKISLTMSLKMMMDSARM